MKDWIAIDFETANSRRHSICAVGIVFVKDGIVSDKFYSLINPEEDFDNYNIAIHGITPEDVVEAQTFDVVYQEIKNEIEGQLLVAHYLPFDGYALKDNLARYNILPTENQLLCTHQLSKRLLPGHASYTLKSLCHYFRLDLGKHHNALEDALACAQLFIKLIKDYDLTDFDAIFSQTRIKPGQLSSSTFHTSFVQGRKLDLSNFEINNNANKEDPLYGKYIVFTGKLVIPRDEAGKLVAVRGGIPQNGVNRQTNLIVTGDFDNVMIKGEKSSKLAKAEKMINEGSELEIISEEEFMKMVW
ncbi:MAG: 3'-5' exoribonuclease [Clostridia bacterium]|nr:3'-5' exoribonuclease [Clostridia bacterium]